MNIKIKSAEEIEKMRVAGRLAAEDYASNFGDLHDPLDDHEALVAADRCYFCHDAPCITACPTDIDIPKIRQDVARDWLAWASVGVRNSELDREELLSEIASRFKTARDELQAIIVAFPDETAVRHQAQWDIATSFLTQARVVAASSPTLARGQFVRATTELLRVAELFHDHPQIGTIPDMLWGVSEELAARSYHDEAISVWNEIQIHYPTHKLSDQSALRIAQTWQHLGQPLRAAEAFLELNFARGGSDADLQNTIYQIAVTLKNEKHKQIT